MGETVDKGYVVQWHIEKDICDWWESLFFEYHRAAADDKESVAEEFQEKKLLCVK